MRPDSVLCPGQTPWQKSWSLAFQDAGVPVIENLQDLLALDLSGATLALGAVPEGFGLPAPPRRTLALSPGTLRAEDLPADLNLLAARAATEARRFLTAAVALARSEPIAPALSVHRALSMLGRRRFDAVGEGPWRGALARMLQRGGIGLRDWDGGRTRTLVVFDTLGLDPSAFTAALEGGGHLFFLAPLRAKDPGSLVRGLGQACRLAVWTYGGEPPLGALRSDPRTLILPENPRGLLRSVHHLQRLWLESAR